MEEENFRGRRGSDRAEILLEKDVAKQAASKISAEDIARLGSSLDEKTLDVLLARQEAGEPVQLLVVGSEDMAAVGETFAEAVGERYAGFIETDVATFDMTSARFVEEGLESDAIDWAKGYDIVLYEPFTWQNNGNVVIEQEHQHLLNVRQLAESHVADVSFLVTPPQPIYRAGYYLTQIQSLKTFTAAQGIPYIDHWENWPDTLFGRAVGVCRCGRRTYGCRGCGLVGCAGAVFYGE